MIRALLGLAGLIVATTQSFAQVVDVDQCTGTSLSRSAYSLQSTAVRGEVRGRVTVTDSADMLKSAFVRLVGSRFGMMITDSSGRFRFSPVPAGRYELAISAIGFEPIRDSIAIGTQGLAIAAALSRPPSEFRDCVSWPDTRRPPNEELKLTALTSDAAGSLRSPAAMLMVRRSLTPSR